VPELPEGPLWANIVAFLLAAAVIGWTGTGLAVLGDKLADRTGLGEAVVGSLFLGLTTALPGLAASITAALQGHAALAISNAIGGIAIQTVFLAVADVVHKKANLEHAAASITNAIQTTILVSLLALVLLGLNSPDVTLAHVHPMTPVLFAAAGGGFWLVYRSSTEPMWLPRKTADTVLDVPEQANVEASLGKLLAGFAIAAGVVDRGWGRGGSHHGPDRRCDGSQ
jgi:cation:H+ antiporter